jgi:hypothetical protein
MTHTRRFVRTLALVAVCSVVALALAGVAQASGSTNYGNFNPMTGRPYTLSEAKLPAAPTIQRVVDDHSDQTLALSLAGAALMVSLLGTGYMLVRVSRLPRPAGSR